MNTFKPGDTAIINGHYAFKDGDTVVVEQPIKGQMVISGINSENGTYHRILLLEECRLSKPEVIPYHLLDAE